MRKCFDNLFTGGRKAVGMFSNVGSADMVEIASTAGFEFVVLDNEHGNWGTECNAHLVRAIDAAGGIPLIRVAALNETYIKWALDIGAAGVMIPNISSAEQARLALRYSRFAPLGCRGACPYVRTNNYEDENRDYFTKANQEVALLLLVEGSEGHAAFDDILEVEGVRYVFFGPYDLSVSMGLPGQITHPAVEDAIREMIGKANRKGIRCGMQGGVTAEANRRWFEFGVDYIITPGENALFLKLCKELYRNIRKGY